MTLLWLILLPFLGGLAAWLVARWSHVAARWVALLALGADLALALGLWAHWGGGMPVPENGSWLMEFRHAWMPSLGISFFFALDGLSLLMVLLTLFLGMISVAISWTEIQERVGFFHFNLLWTLAGIIGVFTALDLFLFYFFWELMLIPMFFLIVIWGHENRVYAAIKFFLFTQLSSLLMLLAIVTLYFVHGKATGDYTFDYTRLLGTPVSGTVGLLLMLGFLIAFAVKLPVFPFHTWLPDAHTEAPTAGSVVLAGLLLKTGAYGMLRFVVPLFPEAAFRVAPLAMALGVIGILYGAVLAFSQKDFKRLVAYTSVSHMGFVMLGVFAWNELALQGVVMQMLSHGLATGALFILAGALQERIHTRDLSEMGGLWSVAPRMGGVALVFAWASLGLPGFGNFDAEFLTLLGAWKVNRLWTVLACGGLIASAVYALWIVQTIFHGLNEKNRVFPDLGRRDMAVMGALIVATVWLGVYPQPVIETARPALAGLTQEVANARILVSPSLSTPSPSEYDSAFLLNLREEANRGGLTSQGFQALLPSCLLSLTAVLAMLLIAFRRRHAPVVFLTVAGLMLALGVLSVTGFRDPIFVASLFVFDSFASFYFGVIAVAAIAVTLFSYSYLDRTSERAEEFYVLLLLATTGAVLLPACTHFISFFLCLEVLSVALYGMLAYTRQRQRSIEAGLKYLILAATSTAFLLFGIALVYLRLGSLNFYALAGSFVENAPDDLLLMAGVGMIFAGFGFKLGVAPFHLWTADVYEGAPAPATAFIATASKAAVFALLLRFFARFSSGLPDAIFQTLAIIAIVSMFAGNLLALRQENIKRLLAYSSIAHLGYMMVAFLAGGAQAPMAVTLYLVVYTITTLGAFGTVAWLSRAENDADTLTDYRGLVWRKPWLAVVFMSMLFSLAGIPLTAGFIGKFWILSAAAESSLWTLLLILVVNSAIGLYYYLRVIVVMLKSPDEDLKAGLPLTTLSGMNTGLAVAAAVLVLLLVALVWLGVYPAPLIGFLRGAALSLLRLQF